MNGVGMEPRGLRLALLVVGLLALTGMLMGLTLLDRDRADPVPPIHVRGLGTPALPPPPPAVPIPTPGR